MVKLNTNHGTIVLELDAAKAPNTVANFLEYAKDGFYNGTIFHRVVPGFVVQGGGYTETIEERELFAPIINESGNGLKNQPMTVAMARFDDPHSATSQFFFNLGDNASLDPNPRSWGYAVFGRVTGGMEVVDEIRFVQTTRKPPFSDVPVESVIIEQVRVIE